MPAKKLIPPYRQVMDALDIIPGTPYTANLKHLIQQWLLQGMPYDDAVKLLPNTQEFQRWHSSNRTDLTPPFSTELILPANSGHATK